SALGRGREELEANDDLAPHRARELAAPDVVDPLGANTLEVEEESELEALGNRRGRACPFGGDVLRVGGGWRGQADQTDDAGRDERAARMGTSDARHGGSSFGLHERSVAAAARPVDVDSVHIAFDVATVKIDSPSVRKGFPRSLDQRGRATGAVGGSGVVRTFSAAAPRNRPAVCLAPRRLAAS